MKKQYPLFKLGAVMILGLLVLAPLTAEAGGEVKGVSATPSPATKATPVTITVTGKDDPCQSLDLDFGDGTPHATYSGPLDPPKTFLHTYTTTGTKTITAKGVNNCKKEASATLTVNAPPGGGISGLTALCQKIACPGVLTYLPPKIDQVVPFVSNITPGGSVVIKGTGFGATEGMLYLRGLKKYNGLELGLVEIPIAQEQGKDFWNPTNALGFIPGTITQVKDQPAKLQIKTAANQWSNEFPVNFMATKDHRLLSQNDPAVQVISCGTGTSYDGCSGWYDPEDDLPFSWFPPYFGCAEVGLAFCGQHYNLLWASYGTDTGVDKFQITLKNGWVLEFMDFTKWISDVGEASVTAPSGFTPGSTAWQPHVPWSATADDSLGYQGFVTIAGPKGVPWK